VSAEPPLNPDDLRPLEPADVVSDELAAALDETAKRALVEPRKAETSAERETKVERVKQLIKQLRETSASFSPTRDTDMARLSEEIRAEVSELTRDPQTTDYSANRASSE
jgi:ribosome-binding ATPase YchF (GTP1/OBG family)